MRYSRRMRSRNLWFDGPRSLAVVFALCLFAEVQEARARQEPGQVKTRIEVVLPSQESVGRITGRVFLTLSRRANDPALLMRSLGHQPVKKDVGVPFFGVDVEGAEPGGSVFVDQTTLGYPVQSLGDLPPGDYYAKAILNVYTRFERADGHVVWAHMDQWEGQHFNLAPGNWTSAETKVRLDPSQGYSIRLELSEVIPPIEIPADTRWVKRVKIKSPRLSEFWGRPIYLGATVLLPKDYDLHPNVFFPTVYLQGHFSLESPWGFDAQPQQLTPKEEAQLAARNRESGHAFYRSWIARDFPRMIGVTFQHPTPYFDDSYAVNSANNGPFADALVEELIPHLEKQFRMIPQAYARVLTGGSTGGYETMALQVHYPKTFGGAWVMYPDPLDFRRVFQVNIYEDDNAFRVPGFGGLAPERFAFRSGEGQPIQSIRQLSQLQRVLGSRGRSADYLDAWEAAFGPVGDDGYPKPLWDKATGRIDREVAHYWRDNGYDLSHYLKTNWSRIGSDLEGKLHISVGDMDNYYFNLSMMQLHEELKMLTDPPYGGSVTLGSPLKIHGWRPTNNAELLRAMSRHISERAPEGADTQQWKYD